MAVTEPSPMASEVELLPTSKDLVVPEPSEHFVNTALVEEVCERALAYLVVGYSIHLAGPSGTGKTTLAFHIASQLGRPVMLIHGDHEFGTSDLVGRDAGYRKFKLVDNYIHSVMKAEEEMRSLWVDNRLTTACREGHTLVYDEFTRSRPEANNVLLSILEEGVLNLPGSRVTGDGYLAVHPHFRAIFTSNPEEYAGVHKTQDALLDRMITIYMDHYDRESEIEITRSKSGMSREEAEIVVDLVRELRLVGVNNHRPTIRSTIAIARITSHLKGKASRDNDIFRKVCKDVLGRDTVKVTRSGKSLMPEMVDEVIDEVCSKKKRPRCNELTANDSMGGGKRERAASALKARGN